MLRLLVVCLTIASALAASSPATSNKSPRSPSSAQQPKQQQTQPKQQPKPATYDDPMLNAINAYAHQYDTTAAPPQYSQQVYPQQLPSSPTLETNFQPIPAPQPHAVPTPVIMQYVPQAPQLSNGGGVQYLQLIPTRPLIVPISPYMSPLTQTYQGPQIVPLRNDIPAGPEVYGSIQPYGTSLQYRGYRFNREIGPNNGPDQLRLNLNEYMPSPSDAPKPANRVRGRP